MPIKDWSEDDRPREKLISKGVDSCTSAELLAILMTNGSREKSAVQLGEEILKKCNYSLADFARASIDVYKEVKGIGDAKACIIKAAAELGNRIRLATLSEDIIVNKPETVFRLMGDLRDVTHEEFWCVFTNNAGKLISRSKIAQGNGSNVTVDVGKVVQKALNANCTRLILCHNHPGGSTRPSTDDIQLTRDIQTVCRVLRITVVEHLIIAGDSYYSFLENDLL